MRRSWYERNEEHRISEDWVKLHCKNITKREKRLLEIVYERRIVRRDHLEIIHEDYRNIPRRTNVINRSIKKLFDCMALDKVHEKPEFMEGNLPAIVAIDKAGSIILNKPFKRRIKQEKRIINQKEMIFREIPPNFSHFHGINALETITIQWILSKNYKFKWFLAQYNEKRFKFNQEDVILIPDVFVVINANNSIFLFFLEYDTGTEDRGNKSRFPVIDEKLDKYRRYKATGVWKEEWWAKQVVTGFPLMLFVTEDPYRIDHINKESKKMGLHVDAILVSDYTKKLDSLVERLSE